MRDEFGTVKGILEQDDSNRTLFKVEDGLVHITSRADTKSPWVEFFEDKDALAPHLDQESLLSSVFRGSYIDLRLSPLENAEDDYQAELKALSSTGKVRTRVITLPKKSD